MGIFKLHYYLLLLGLLSPHPSFATDSCTDFYKLACNKSLNSQINDGTEAFNKETIQDLWREIKISAHSFIEQQIKSKTAQTEVLKIIDAISLTVEVCLDDPTLANANFSQAKKTVTYCAGSFLTTTSLFEQVAVLAHELGHSLEPCSFNFESYAFKNVESCLRSNESVDANVWGFIDANDFQSKCSNYLSACDKGLSPACQNYERYNCDKGEPRCLKDQISESFADWFGTEVLSQMIKTNTLFFKLKTNDYINGFKNIARSSCDSHYSIQNIYPQPQDRYNKILLAHPVVREKMGCFPNTSAPRYCESAQD